MKDDYSKDELNKIFEYRDGELYYKKKTHKNMADALMNKPVGYISPSGYKQVFVGRKFRGVHRYIFAMHYGYYPKCIDHIDGNKVNNKIENLRDVTFRQNCLNRKKKSNHIGAKGVVWHSRDKKWSVNMFVDGKRKYFGYYKDFELAELVAIEARNKFHKEFANHG